MSTESSSSTTSMPVTSFSAQQITPLCAYHQVTIKLTSTNYLLWKTQITPLLVGHQLMHHVDGSSSVPPKEINGAPNPVYVDWFVNDQIVWDGF